MGMVVGKTNGIGSARWGHGWTSHYPWRCQERHWFKKGRLTEARRTLALLRPPDKHCQAGAGRFKTARAELKMSRPGVLSPSFSLGDNQRTRAILPAAFTRLSLWV